MSLSRYLRGRSFALNNKPCHAFEHYVTVSIKRGSYVGIHSTGFRDFLLKPELQRAIQDSGFEHPRSGLGPGSTGPERAGPAQRPNIQTSTLVSPPILGAELKGFAITHANEIGKQLTSQGNMTCMLCGVETGSKAANLTDRSEHIISISINPTNQHVFVSGACDTFAKMWDIRTGKAVQLFPGHE